ncbi:hypothetical protein [Rugosimonospora africana]|uniref:Uncharacterized protein n=1 Tax=Rugosimonospora africana TaxID=556532 RepID=A0A8J3R385_9ACTN|nr:hypothetical protein [Rugosimonospora africana]GIH21573.1 hypothetical protein Raf01_97450 [Rugosimonospora africana]
MSTKTTHTRAGVNCSAPTCLRLIQRIMGAQLKLHHQQNYDPDHASGAQDCSPWTPALREAPSSARQ